MTSPVGSIRLDLTIDGAGALSALAGQVKTALGSIDSSVNATDRDLNKLERDFGAVGRSATRTTGPVAALAEGVDQLGGQYRQAATSAEAFKVAQPSTRSLNAQAAAVNRLAVSYARLSAAQTAASRAPQLLPPPPTRRIGSSGRGGGGGRGGALGFLTGPVGLNSIALGATALPPATLAVTNLVGAVQQLGQSLIVLPGLMAGAASSIGVAVLGFKGMGDAIKALNEGDLEKAAEAMKDMDPAAQNLAKSVSRFTQGPLKDLRRGLQGRMFPGVAEEFDDLVEKRMPNLTKGLGGIADAWNGTLKQLISTAGSDSTGGILDRIFGNTAEGQKRANAAIEPLVKGIGTLAAAGTDVIPRLADALGAVATRFSNFITAADQDGRLAKWIDEGLTGVTNLGNTFLSLGKSIASITKAAGGDGGLLKLMEQGSSKLAEFLGSEEGQAKLAAFFTDAKARMAEWLPILGNIATVIGDVFRGFQQWGDTILPIVGGVASALADMPGLVQGAVTAFLAFKTFSGLASLIGSVTRLGGLLDGLPAKAQRAGGAMGGPQTRLGRAGGMFGAVAAGGLFGLGVDTQAPGAGLNALTALGGAMATGAQFGGAPGAVLAGAMAALTISVDNMRAAFNREAQTRADLANMGKGNAPGVGPRPEILPGAAVQPPTDLRGVGAVGRGFTLAPRIAPVVGPATGVTGFEQLPGLAAPGVSPGPLNEIAGAAQNATTKIGNLDEALGSLTSPPPIKVEADTNPAEQQIKGFIGRTIGRGITIPVTAAMPSGPRVTPPGGSWFNPGRADGGLLPGYSPGVDNLLVPMSGGEGVVIPEAMRALGPRWLYGINSRFRSGLRRSNYGFADGGVVGGGLGGDLVVNLLTQIRDALLGKLQGPLSDTATGVDALSGGLTGAGVAGVATFGGDMGKQFIAGIVNGFGGDSRTLFPEFTKDGLPIGFTAGGLGGGNTAAIVAALAKFATTGDTADLAGSGLGAGDSVVSAIVTARNKKKNGLTDEEIAGLVNQVLGGGGFSGVLDDRNSSLVKSLSTYGRKLTTTGGAPAAASPTMGALPGGGSADALIMLAQAANGGQYKWGASDLAKGLADCSGAVSDLVEVATKGQADSGRLFSTHNAAEVLQGLGAVPGLVPGALQIGFSPTHMAATLPNGVNFEAGGAGRGIQYGGGAAGAGDAQFTEQWSLPAGGMSGLTDALGSMGQDMCGCIGDNMGAGLGQLGRDLITGAGGVAGEVGADIAAGFGGTYKPSGPNAKALDLIKERNPAALATLFGYNVPDLSRTGGGAAAQNLMVSPGPGFTAQGQMLTDTAALIDRSMSSLQIVMEARFQQMQDVLNQIRDQLAQIASQLIQAAASGGASTAAAAIPAAADGRVFPGYAPGVDSILARVSPGEGVLIPEAVRGLGGPAGVYAINSRFRRGLNRANYPGVGGLPAFANGGVVSGSVGADFFGLSEIPIIGGIVNMLVSILLKILGIEIQARDTLQNMSANIREFRGDFKAFDATGRLASDSSGLVDRNESSRDVVNKERVRILTQVIVGVIKYVIEKIIMPLINSAIQAAINFGTQAISSAVGMGVNAVAPGAGGVAGGITNAAVSALGSIAQTGGQIFTEFLGSFLTNGLTVLTEGIASILPSMAFQIFDIPGMFKMLFGGIAGLLGGLVGGIGGIAGGFFDSGGLALGTGYLAKDTIKPERVLSPRETVAFESWLNGPNSRGNGRGGDTYQKEIHATIVVPGGGPDTAQKIYDRLDTLV